MVAVLLGHELDSGWAYGLGLGFTLVGAAVFAFSRIRYEGVPQEAIIGVTWAVASSAAILTVSKAPHGAEDIQSLLVDSILWVRAADVARAAGVYAVVGLFHIPRARREKGCACGCGTFSSMPCSDWSSRLR